MSLQMFSNIAIAIIGILTVIAYLLLTVGSHDPRLPHSSPTLPIIGNLHQLPKRRLTSSNTLCPQSISNCLTKVQICRIRQKMHGGLYTVKVGHHIIAVITNRRVVRELLELKGLVSSNRPSSYISQELIGQGNHLLTLQYDPKWRKYCQLIHQCFMESMCDQHYVHLQHAEVVQMLRNLIVAPNVYFSHARRSLIISVYGVRVPSIRSTYLEHLYELLYEITALLEFGAIPPVYFYPFLKRIPERLLGNGDPTHTTLKKNYGVSPPGTSMSLTDEPNSVKRAALPDSSFMDRILNTVDELNFSDHQLTFLGGGLV
ncbi:conserved hypothetical protein [Talaromyces stipitatus ATCC 10500]|uniref:Cytochrome P450 n=1 Tax=Talaromyces stipitatus (strain ATCC 10500 / CBS 375.48 / QM 6759 / NRRL 1006) TaxID=441959 RepID=B8LXP2_TALSN|nr:uncharacterized protein TSTA_079000 [Talaromyces stipitatus ATCC 10500]EED24543.1 conserved hypothetical protein [Talaromyces stipitatus ATCC 10500]